MRFRLTQVCDLCVFYVRGHKTAHFDASTLVCARGARSMHHSSPSRCASPHRRQRPRRRMRREFNLARAEPCKCGRVVVVIVLALRLGLSGGWGSDFRGRVGIRTGVRFGSGLGLRLGSGLVSRLGSGLDRCQARHQASSPAIAFARARRPARSWAQRARPRAPRHTSRRVGK